MVNPRAVAAEVAARNFRPIGLGITLGVVEYGARHGGPGPADHEQSAAARRYGFSLAIDNGGLDAEERACGRTGLGGNGAGHRREHDRSRFRLPPGVDDRTPSLTDDFAIPDPGLGIDRLAHGTQQTQAGE